MKIALQAALSVGALVLRASAASHVVSRRNLLAELRPPQGTEGRAKYNGDITENPVYAPPEEGLPSGHGHQEVHSHHKAHGEPDATHAQEAHGHGHDAGHGHEAAGHGAASHGKEGGHGHGHDAEHGHDALIPHHDSGHGHGHGEGHGHGGAHAGHHHPPPKPVALAYSLCLMGAVAFVSIMFYLTNYNDEDIRRSTWRTVSLCVSIFCSVLIYLQIRSTIADTFEFFAGHVLSNTEISMICVPLYLVLYLLLQVVLFFLQSKSHETMHGVAEIFAHTAAFSAMFGFDSLIQVPLFGGQPHMALVVLVLAFVVQATLGIAAHKLRMAKAMEDGVVTKDEEHWMGAVEEAENDVIALSLSFLITAVCRGFIIGRVYAYQAAREPRGISFTQVWTLFGCAMFWFVVAMLTTWAGLVLEHGPMAERVIKISKSVTMFASCWCLIFWADWFLYELGFEGTRIEACLIMALILTAFAAVEIFMIDAVADRLAHHNAQRGLRYTIVSLGVLVGFSWEKAFDIAMEDIAHSAHILGIPPTTCLHILAMMLLVVVLPAWYYYILPKTIESIEEEEQEREREYEKARKSISKRGSLAFRKSKSRAF